MGTKRLEHWETRSFHEFLKGRASAPFVWGTNDCAMFTADAVQSISGIDIAESFRGKYSDEAGSLQAIHEVCGGSSLADALAWCAAKSGMQELQYPLMAKRGDMVLCDRGDGILIAAVIHLSGRPVSVGPQGMMNLSVKSIQRAWHYE